MFSPLRSSLVAVSCLLAVASLTTLSVAQLCPTGTPCVTTWHDDNNRTGWQQNESILTTAAGSNQVNQSNFGLLYQWTVSGSVYAQPLAVSNVPVSGCTTNCPNVVFVATERDMLYAFNAASSTGATIWKPINLAANLGQYVDCSTTKNQNQFPVCNQNGDDDGDPPSPFTGLSLGVTGTPVIDPNTYTLYVAAAVQNSSDTAMNYYLFAVDIRSGTVLGSPTLIAGSVNGSAPASGICGSTYPQQGQVKFYADSHIQRSALLLLPNGAVYVAFAPYPESNNGWMFGYTFSNGQFSSPTVFNSTPNGTGGGIWGSGAGPAATADGSSIYVAIGNGTAYDVVYGVPIDMGDSLLRLDPSTLAMVDYYTPGNVFTFPPIPPRTKPGLCPNDEDFGSGGTLLIPNFPYNGNSTNLVVNADKQSNLYVANQMSLGGYSASTTSCPSSPNNIQCITTPPRPLNDPYQGYWASPAYWQYTTGSTTNYMLYYSVTTQNTAAAPKALNGYSLSTSGPPIPSTYVSTTTLFCPFSPTPSVSSKPNNSASGIVWAIENQTGRDQSNNNCANGPPPYVPAALHAFNAIPNGSGVLTELYTSSHVQTPIGFAKAFPTPTVFVGHVYMGTSTGPNNNLPGVDVFGLCGIPSVCLP